MSQRRIRKFKEKLEKAQKALAEAQRHALVDPLTGVLNKRGLDNELNRAFAQADRLKCALEKEDRLKCEFEKEDRQEKFLAVLFIDMNDFKGINDTFGHRVGNVVLAGTAKFLTGAVRVSDIVARAGGDEFVVILPASNLQTAHRVAAKISQEITHVPFEDKVKVSLSVGAASTSEPGVLSLKELLERADERMYKEKKKALKKR